MEWVRPDYSPQLFSADRARCEYEAELATNLTGTPSSMGAAVAQGIMIGSRKTELIGMCMKIKGWQLRPKAA